MYGLNETGAVVVAATMIYMVTVIANINGFFIAGTDLYCCIVLYELSDDTKLGHFPFII